MFSIVLCALIALITTNSFGQNDKEQELRNLKRKNAAQAKINQHVEEEITKAIENAENGKLPESIFPSEQYPNGPDGAAGDLVTNLARSKIASAANTPEMAYEFAIFVVGEDVNRNGELISESGFKKCEDQLQKSVRNYNRTINKYKNKINEIAKLSEQYDTSDKEKLEKLYADKESLFREAKAYLGDVIKYGNTLKNSLNNNDLLSDLVEQATNLNRVQGIPFDENDRNSAMLKTNLNQLRDLFKDCKNCGNNPN